MTRYEQLKRDLLQNFKEFQDIKAPGGSDLANEIVASKMARSIVDAIPASTFNVVGEMPCSQINVYDKNFGDLFTTIDAGNLFGAVTLTVNKGWIVWWSGDRFVKVYEGVQGGGSSVTVDQSLDITSANPIANAPVAAAIVDVNRRIDELEPGENVQSDWEQDDDTSPDFIKNKPEIPAAITVDSALSSTSTNPVQNKAVYNEFTWKINRVTGAAAGNLPAFTANGSLTDSGKKPSDFATPTDIDSAVSTHNSSSSAHSDIRTAIDGKYSKPSTGIPKSDLASSVQTSLGKADTALQEHQSLDGYVKTSVIADHAFGTSKWIDIGYFSLSATWQSSSIIVNREFYGAQKATQDIISCSRDTSSGDMAAVTRVNLQERGNQASYDWKYAIVNGAVHVYVLDSYGTRHSRFEVTPIGSSGTFTVDAVYNADVTGANDIPIGGHVSRADNGSTYYRVLAKHEATQYWSGIRLFDTQVADSTTSTGFALMTMEKLTNLIEVQKKNVVVDYRSANNSMYLLSYFSKTESSSVADLIVFVSIGHSYILRYIWVFEDERTGAAFAYEYDGDIAEIDDIPTTLSQLADDSSHRLVTDSQINTWNGKQDALSSQTAYSSKGTATKVPQITTNSVGQVTNITEVTISQPSVPTASTSTPLMDGTASYGSGTTYARGNHRHPSDTSKANKPSTYTSGHLASLDSNGNLADSGKAPSDFVPSNFSKCQENSSGKWYKVATITQKGTNKYCLMCAKIEIMSGDNVWSNVSTHMSNFATYNLMIRRNGDGTNHPSGASGNTFMIKKNVLYGMESMKISAGFVSKISGGKLSADIWVKGNTDSTSGYSNNILARVVFAGCGMETTDKGVTVTYYDQTSGESTVPDSIFREATRKVIAATSA